jgi:hypothetical protein
MSRGGGTALDVGQVGRSIAFGLHEYVLCAKSVGCCGRERVVAEPLLLEFSQSTVAAPPAV